MKNNLISMFCEMRSDFKDNTDTINKMIQFGTVKYGIVKQLKDRSRSDRDVTSDQEENGSCSPIVNCKSSSPDIHRNNISSVIFNHSGSDEDHNHNNNLMSDEHNDSQTKLDQTYLPEIERINKFPSPTPPDLEINNQPLSRSPTINRNETRTQSDYDEEDNNMSDGDEVGGVVQQKELEEDDEVVGRNEEEQTSELKLKTASETIRQSAEDQLAKINESAVANANASNGERNGSPLQMPQFPPGPVTLEAIQNMQMAIAQFAAKTIANGGTGADNEAAMKQLAFLQQTLFNLQQQQLFQIQLIQQLQSQIALNQIKHDDGDGDGDDEEEEEGEEDDEGRENQIERDDEMNDHDGISDAASIPLSLSRPHRPTSLSSNQKSSESNQNNTDRMELSNKLESCLTESLKRKREDRDLIDEYEHSRRNSLENRINQKDAAMMALASKQDENTPLPYGSDLASSIITNHDDLPSLDEPNSLEMLQKRAQEVLDSASQGILANNLADEFAFGKDKSADGKNRNEPFFKHRCRYCGKVFGSDSALQIHIRSHTGERPFKCNVCGSRFTTKGNLKVHFQRHAQKFPHIPMNATPIPEHLDKFHPPLLEQMSPDSSPTHQPQMPSHLPNMSASIPMPFPPGAGFPGLPALYRPPMDLLKALGPYPNPFFGSMPQMPPVPTSTPSVPTPLASATADNDEDMPTDLRKSSAPSSPEKDEPIREETEEKEETLKIQIKEEKLDEVDQCDELEQPLELTSPKSMSPSPPPSIPQLSSQTPKAVLQEPEKPPSPQPTPPTSNPSTTPTPSSNLPPVVQPQQPPVVRPQLSPSSMPHQNFDLMPLPGQLPPLLPHLREDFLHDRFPLKFQRTSPERRSPICSPASIPRSPFFGPMKHEMAVLPRPHSNDNSWENFIEVSNTSETLKLKELMKNKKLTDPNQCVVCDRVLSCKSALQMHYRTHTGERPFRCRICGRAFTTKGNLKTHMAVHKIRPPMRNFHQCPVCHKKYSNALVLQQHIRLHTGEPTDLTPEQIQAAEIRDPPPSMMHGSFLNPFAFHFGMGGPMHNGNGMGSESSQGDMDDNMDCSDDFDDDLSDHMSNCGDSDRPRSSDEMKGMLFEQKLKIDNYRPKSRNSIISAPASPISVLNKSSPVPSEVSQGALDLTPRAPPSVNVSALPAPAIKALTPTSPTSPSIHSKHQQQQLQLHQQQQQQHHELQQRQQEQLRHHELQQRQLQHHHQQQQQLQQQHHLQSNPALMATRPPFGMFPNIPLFPPATTQNMCSAMNSIAQSVMPAAPFNPLALSGVRGSTTCGICFKTFPCHSALEIHYRSHTKERPFKCETCERGFTTKGNLKQHMLTHKIRDMEQETYKNRAVKFEYMSGWKKDFD